MTSATEGPDLDDPVGRYLEVGLRLGRHLDGRVDAYYGPEALAERVADEPIRPLPASQPMATPLPARPPLRRPAPAGGAR